MDDIKFASLLCSRLCHDLVSPVGALANGVEILADEQDEEMRAQVIDLLGMSAGQTTGRLQFFRMAFGAAGGFGAELDLGEARAALEKLLAGGKVEISWNAAPAAWPKDVVKLMLNLALIASESLVRGGRLTLDAEQGETAYNVAISAEGERVILQEIAKDLLMGCGDDEQVEPREMPAYLARRLADHGAAKLEITDLDDQKMALMVAWPL